MRRFKILRNLLLALAVMLPLIASTPSRPVLGKTPELSTRMNAFAVDLLQTQAATTEASANALFSPQGIYQDLALSYTASGGATKSELARALHFPDDIRMLVNDLRLLRREIERDARTKGVQISIANSVWLDTTYAQFRPEYLNQFKFDIPAVFHFVPLIGNRALACAEINRWVEQMTQGRVKGTLNPGDLVSRTTSARIDEPALVSVDAVHFKADWANRFDKTGTVDGSFVTSSTQTNTVRMMHQHLVLAYSEDNNFQFLELPYTGGAFSMCVLLPKQILPVSKIAALITTNTVTGLAGTAQYCEVDVQFPRFTMGNHFSIKDALVTMGVKDAFDKIRANFDAMIDKNIQAYRIYLSEIYHDAWMAVDEDGTEAAAATTSVHYSIGCSASSLPVDFHANHPFAFFIVHKPSQSVVFAGWVGNPKSM